MARAQSRADAASNPLLITKGAVPLGVDSIIISGKKLLLLCEVVELLIMRDFIGREQCRPMAQRLRTALRNRFHWTDQQFQELFPNNAAAREAHDHCIALCSFMQQNFHVLRGVHVEVKDLAWHLSEAWHLRHTEDAIAHIHPAVRELFRAIASGELTEADFKA